MKLCSVAAERSSVTGKPHVQEVSAWHEEPRERPVWPPGAAVQMVHA
ncbi:hypothetical protein BDA96_01G416500 [Sorghum bicolor]|uniref:Uncharacterized protein n=1 Tax=Sorghum bicolor TaxID=4558 RepID=A0A921S4C0_SORBI|nr:hypothetical protein BDA96_01G416500 [Sorghum bicolor]